MGTFFLHRLKPGERSCTPPISAHHHPGVHHVQHAEAVEPSADGWPSLVMDAPQRPQPRHSSRNAATPLPSLSLIYHPARHGVEGTEGRDKVAAATIPHPRDKHSLAATPGLWVLPGFSWVKTAFPQVEEGRTEKRQL